MSKPGSPPPERVPTLTEVVAWPGSAPAAELAPPGAVPPAEANLSDARTQPEVRPRAALRVPEDQVIQGVLAEVQRQVDLMLEQRLREVLTPLLTRAADNVIRDARRELASTLRDVVARAVAQELSRHRTP